MNRTNLLILLVFSIISVYIFEVGFWGIQTYGRHQKTRLERMIEMAQKGVEATPNISATKLLLKQDDKIQRSAISINGVEVLPLGGISNKKTLMCEEASGFIDYQSDEFGFHNPHGKWKPNVDIVAIGDSFTYGACVPSEKNYMSLIRELHPSTVNLGMDGSGPLIELAIMKEYLPHLKPKATLWFYYEMNDLGDLRKEMGYELLRRYIESGFNQDLFHRQAEIDLALSKHIENELQREKQNRRGIDLIGLGMDRMKLGTLRKLLGLDGSIFSTHRSENINDNQIHAKEFRKILQQARDFVETWDGKFYFVFIPTWHRYAGRPEFKDNREAIIALVRGLGIPVIDLYQPFSKHGDPLSLFPNRKEGHFNEKGHAFVARIINESFLD